MRMLTRRSVLVATTVWVMLSAPVYAIASELPLETVRNIWGMPYQVQVERTDGGAVVSGKLRASTANPGRRLYGRVWAEIVDQNGEVVAVHYGKPRRMSPAKYTRRARFKIEIDQIPDGAAGIRVGYR